MANEKISEYANSVSELEDTDLLDCSKDIGGGNFQSQKLTAAILRNFFKSAAFAFTGAPQTIVFSSPLPNLNYQVMIIDANGIGWGNLGNFTVNGFDVEGLAAGNAAYIAVLDN